MTFTFLKELFKFPFVKEIFIDENYISITKYEINEWQEITLELRSFIKQYIENGGTVLDENYVATVTAEETIKAKEFDNLDVTSQQIINILEEYVKPEMKVFDVGTGSGILAIAASKLGAKDIEAADYDNVAVDVARENIEKNHECENIKIFQSDLLKNMNGKADLIIANIIADIIIRMFNDVDNYLNQHGAILTSGIIADRIADVTKAAEEHGFMVEKMNEKAGWAAIIFRRKEDMQ